MSAMKRLLPFGFLLLMLSAIVLASGQGTGTGEPPLELSLSVNGTEYPITIGEELQVLGEFVNPVFRVQSKPERVLRIGGMSLAYPAYYTYEYNASEDSNIWTLSGKSVTVVVCSVPGHDTSLKDYAAIMSEHFGDSVTGVSPQTIEVGGKTLETINMDISLLGNAIFLELFRTELQNDTLFFSVQHTLEDDELCEESIHFRELLRTSFVFGQ